jgi:hypothetical protein
MRVLRVDLRDCEDAITRDILCHSRAPHKGSAARTPVHDHPYRYLCILPSSIPAHSRWSAILLNGVHEDLEYRGRKVVGAGLEPSDLF